MLSLYCSVLRVGWCKHYLRRSAELCSTVFCFFGDFLIVDLVDCLVLGFLFLEGAGFVSKFV